MSRPESPCIGLCTILHDDICKGCGRSYLEVPRWIEMDDAEREAIWLRIESEQTAWRFTKYKDRV